MKYLKKHFFHITKSQRIGLYISIILILLFEIIQNISFEKNDFTLTETDKLFLKEYAIISKAKNNFSNKNTLQLKDSISPFNPNDLTKQEWIQLGFSDKQADIILKYKKIVGGEFISKEEFSKCYVIDEEKYQKLEPYLLLPSKKEVNKDVNTPSVTYKNFNPNDLPQQGWEKLGFSTKQAEIIMKYKQILGGKFTSKEQLKKCFVISDEKYLEMKPYILLPEKTKQDEKFSTKQTKAKINYSSFNPNLYTEKDWQKIGFTSKQAETIIKYKKILGGKFTNKDQLRKCYVISDEKYIELEPYITFNTNNEQIEQKSKTKENENVVSKTDIKNKFNPNDLTKEEWIKLGFTEKQANTILNFKKSLGGEFKDAKTLKRCYAISEEKFKEIEPYLYFK
ncbi:helix-hairpin-helix domain-containing protein [Chishuiella sp.]|uniref:helix-hairpin-helix domain-containing protein n=1 Tax=Chishuiella sp. TaxID=1969467 RepID=UPI0028ACABC0|nr:helix-hairpin-helix domain-containing protein [Chishuiella sp.]